MTGPSLVDVDGLLDPRRMILAYGSNVNATLSTSPDPFLGGLLDVTAELGVDDIVWTGWGATIGYRRSSNDYLIWGFSPSVLHQQPCPLPPTRLNLPAQPRSFVGHESLEGFVSTDGDLFVPDGATMSWRQIVSQGGWLDVKRLGTGMVLGLHRHDPSRVIQAASIQAFSMLEPVPRSVPLQTPTFARIVPSTSHAFILPATAHLHPPHALGSNLHSQLARPIHPTLVDEPMPIELLEGLGEIKVQAAGVHGLALTEAGEVFIWGGRFGAPDDPVDLASLDGQDCSVAEDVGDEPLHILAASIGSTGAVILGLSDGRVVASRADEVDILPTRPADGPRRTSREEEADDFEWRELKGVGDLAEERALRNIVPASGGRGWLLLYD